MGICTAILIVMFIGLFAWAYSSRRTADFTDASQLPLREDHREESLT